MLFFQILLFAGYLYMRGIRKRHGSRLKWMVIAGFVIAVINYLAARYPIEVLNRPPRPDQFPRKQEGGD